MMEDMDVSLKVIVVGNGRVGKTSMITRFAQGVMTDAYKKTIGTDFMEKEITLASTGEIVKLMLWDTAGQEMFSKLTRSYYKGSGAVVYVFSTTDRDSFEEVERWQRRVEEECGPISSVLVQNKIDLIDQSEITTQEVEDLARRMKVKLYRTCVKDNIRVDDVFEYVANSFVEKGGDMQGYEAVQDIGTVGRQSQSGSEKVDKVDTRGTQPVASNHARTFVLEPSVRRTGGKKSMKFACTIL